MLQKLKNISIEDIVPFIFIFFGIIILEGSVDFSEIISNSINYMKELNGQFKALHIAVAFVSFNLAYLFWYLKNNFMLLSSSEVLSNIFSILIYSFGMVFLIVLLFINYDITDDLAAIVSVFGLVTIYINGKRKFDKLILNKLNVDPFKK